MLKQNGLLLAQMPLRHQSGILCDTRTMWGRSERMNLYAGEGMTEPLSGVPNGHLAPSAWILPMRPGGMSAYVGTSSSMVVTLPGLAAGMALSGSSDMSMVCDGVALQLIVSATGSADMSMTTTSTIAGALSASGSADMSLSLGSSTLGALAGVAGNAAMSLSCAIDSSATIGHMSGNTIAVSESLTAEQVWLYMMTNGKTAQQNVVGTTTLTNLIPGLF